MRKQQGAGGTGIRGAARSCGSYARHELGIFRGRIVVALATSYQSRRYNVKISYPDVARNADCLIGGSSISAGLSARCQKCRRPSLFCPHRLFHGSNSTAIYTGGVTASYGGNPPQPTGPRRQPCDKQ